MSIVIGGKLVQKSIIRQSIINAGIVNQEGGGGPTPPLPPIRPGSFLKYSFNQTNLTSAITDRVTGVDQLSTTIGTDVNAIQSDKSGILTFNQNTQAFDIGVGALIERDEETLISSNMTQWTNSVQSTATYDSSTKESRWLFDSGNTQHSFFSSVSVASGLPYVFSMIVKKGESQFLQFTGGTGFDEFVVNFDLLNGSLNVQVDFASIIESSIKDIGEYYLVYVVAECTASTSLGAMIATKADSLTSPKNPSTNDSGAFTVKYPNFIQSKTFSSPIDAAFGAAQRGSSKPSIPSNSIIDSTSVCYCEYIHLSALEGLNAALWLYEGLPIVRAPGEVVSAGVFDSGDGTDSVIALASLKEGEAVPDTIAVTMLQGVKSGDRILCTVYLSPTLFTLEVLNKTTGETQQVNSADMAGVIAGGLKPILLGEAGIFPAINHKKIDFEITEYTDPVLPDFADNGDFANNGDFDNG